MKVWLWKNNVSGKLTLWVGTGKELAPSESTFLGSIEIDPQMPKKMVTKSFRYHDRESLYASSDNIPPNAKRIEINFDVEE